MHGKRQIVVPGIGCGLLQFLTALTTLQMILFLVKTRGDVVRGNVLGNSWRLATIACI